MCMINPLCDNLQKQTITYENLLEIESAKLQLLSSYAPAEELDRLANEEQVYILQAKGLEVRRVRIVDDLGFHDLTVSQIIKKIDESSSQRLKDVCEKLSYVINQIKVVSNDCNLLLETSLYNVQNALKKNQPNASPYPLGGKPPTNSGFSSGGSLDGSF